ncbi:receptor-type tyrosine-protein phosphatase F-like [Lineus longissimus]|uniref:receptor-type tyrosine-protein phosphatase F-like n=1 Tax=Lineus longissimus TaxID=88925 RepID=UPI00315D9D99
MSTLPVFLLLFGCCFYNIELSAADCEDESYQGLRLPRTWVAPGSSSRNGIIFEEFIDVYHRKPRGENVTKYEVRYSKKSIPVLEFRTQTTLRQSRYTDLPLSFDYDFQVRAYNEKGVGPWSESEGFIAEKGRLRPPRNIRVERLTPKRYSVTFDPPIQSSWRPITIHSYRIFHSYHASGAMTAWNQTEVLAGTTAEFTVSDPTKTYVVKVQAREVDGRYGNLSTIYVPTYYPIVTPGKPCNLRVVSKSSTFVWLRWDHPNDWQTGSLTSYLLEYQKSTRPYGGSYGVFLPSTRTEYKADGLISGTSYTFNLTAKYLGEPVREGPAIIRAETST